MSKMLPNGDVEFDANDVFRMAAKYYKTVSEKRLIWIRILIAWAGLATGGFVSQFLLRWIK